MLTVYHSNRLEVLAEQLAALVRQPTESPFALASILVQSLVLTRWLSLPCLAG
jgi:exonuclease V gamma subunit